jgi:DNA-binding XRE family transcriptional regulator
MAQQDLKFDKQRFKEFREKSLKLNQQDAAEKLGIKRQTLANWEKGGHTPSITQLSKIGQAYDVSGTFFLVEE